MRAFVEADMEHGVRAFPIEELEGLHLRICRPMGLSSQDARQVVNHVLGRLGDKYDLKNVFDLARYLLPTPPVPTSWRRRMLALGSSDPTRAICSTLIAEAFEAVGFPILPIIASTAAAALGCPDRVRELSMFAITAYSSHATSTFRHTSRSSSRAHAATIVLQYGLTPINWSPKARTGAAREAPTDSTSPSGRAGPPHPNGKGAHRQRPRLRLCEPFPAESAAGALWRVAARCYEFPRPVSGGQRTAGLGGGNAVHAAAGDPGAATGRAARQALCRSALPDWLPDVTLTDLRLGRQRFHICFWRDGKDTRFKVLTGKCDSVEWKSVALSASAVGG